MGEAFRFLNSEPVWKLSFWGGHQEGNYDEMEHCRALMGLPLFKSRRPVMFTLDIHGITRGQGRQHGLAILPFGGGLDVCLSVLTFLPCSCNF